MVMVTTKAKKKWMVMVTTGAKEMGGDGHHPGVIRGGGGHYPGA